MKYGLRALALMLLVLGALGCSISSKYMTKLPVAQPLPVDAGTATVVFIRPSDWAKGAKHVILDEKGRFLGEGWGETYFAAQVPPGEHMFISWSEGTPALKATLSAGKIYYVEIGGTIGAWSMRARLFAIGPNRPQWAELPGWLGKCTMLTPSPAGLQAFMSDEGEDVADVVRKGLENYATYDGEELQKRTMVASDGVATPLGGMGGMGAMASPVLAPASAKPTTVVATAPAAAAPAVGAGANTSQPGVPRTGGCADDAECKGGRLCREGRCVPASEASGCKNDSECKGGRVCRTGLCVAPPPCHKDKDCPGDQICADGACKNPR